jgi:hypothetical protein
VMRLPFTFKRRWIAIIWLSGDHKIHTKLSNMCETVRRWMFSVLQAERRFTDHFFFAEATATGHVYHDMPEHFLVPQLDVNNVIWQQDGAPPHYHRDVPRYLNQTFPGRWIGRGGYIPWPPRSPDLTPMARHVNMATSA